jgi:class 3 adenylate cyclase
MSSSDLRADIVTVMFTDVEGFTDLATRRGDAAAQRVISAERRLVREQVERYGGREIDQIGDGFMVAFTSPRRAITCALAIQDAVAVHNLRNADEALQIRVGLNIGEVIDEGGHPFGAAVNGAARVAGKAKGGEILVAESVKQLAGTIPEALFRDRGRFALKGFPDRWRLYEVRAKPTNGAVVSQRSVLPVRLRAKTLKWSLTRWALAAAAAALAAVAVITVFVLTTRSSDATESQTPNSGGRQDLSISVGRSIGSASMGTAEADVRKAYGEPEATREWTSRGRSGTTATYSVQGGILQVSYTDGRVIQIATTSPRYETDGGIHVGLLNVPDPASADTSWRSALETGELVQTGPGEYVWRGFKYGGSHDYCATGYGAVTMLILRGQIVEIRISKRDYVLDRLPEGADALFGTAPCKGVL